MDVVLFDNASQVIEFESIASLLFMPKAFLLFGDQCITPKDRFNMEAKCKNFNQSLYQRFHVAKQLNGNNCQNMLRDGHRFGLSIHNFLNHQFYNNNMIFSHARNTMDNDLSFPINNFRIVHGNSDQFMLPMLQKMFRVAGPAQYKYAIICPPTAEMSIFDNLDR